GSRGRYQQVPVPELSQLTPGPGEGTLRLQRQFRSHLRSDRSHTHPESLLQTLRRPGQCERRRGHLRRDRRLHREELGESVMPDLADELATHGIDNESGGNSGPFVLIRPELRNKIVEALRCSAVSAPTDRQLWEMSCLTRAQAASWTDDDLAKHSAGVRNTLKTLFELLDARTEPQSARCICQEQHRRGYCTEPGCPYAQSRAVPTGDWVSEVFKPLPPDSPSHVAPRPGDRASESAIAQTFIDEDYELRNSLGLASIMLKHWDVRWKSQEHSSTRAAPTCSPQSQNREEP